MILSEGPPMSPKARREYILDMRRRYAAATYVARTALLDEIVAMTGYHRKYALALMHREPRAPIKRQRRATYGPAVREALLKVWRAADYPWSVRLKGLLPLWLPWLHEHMRIDRSTQDALLRISVRSIDRLLRAKRGEIRRRLYGHTRPGRLLKTQVPIRAERWDVDEPGWSELDLVAHCGGNGSGEFLNSLNLTDIASTWTQSRAIRGKGERETVRAIEHVRQQLPFGLLGLDSDSGSEFINYHCVRYCETQKLKFTRSRPYKKNDNAHIEQKNWTHVRKIFGWQRLEGTNVADMMNDLYDNELRIWLNYFQPSVKLIKKIRVGSRVRKVYDAPQTALDRLIVLGALSDEQKHTMINERAACDPFILAQTIERKIKNILEYASPSPERIVPRGPGIRALSHKEARIERTVHSSGKILSGATVRP